PVGPVNFNVPSAIDQTIVRYEQCMGGQRNRQFKVQLLVRWPVEEHFSFYVVEFHVFREVHQETFGGLLYPDIFRKMGGVLLLVQLVLEVELLLVIFVHHQVVVQLLVGGHRDDQEEDKADEGQEGQHNSGAPVDLHSIEY